MKAPHKYLLFSYPMEGICLFQIIGIVIASLLPFHAPPAAWLVLCIYLVALSFFLKSTLRQSICLLTAILAMSASITSLQDKANEASRPLQVITAQRLSPIDNIQLKALSLRKQAALQYQRLHIKDQELAIISAMTLGDKSALSQTTRADYSASGASHILAVSGLHIGIIFQIFLLMVGGRRRFLTLSLAILAIWAYVLFIGMPASAIRSALMITLYCLSATARRQSKPIHNLSLAAFLMLLWNPRYLFDISFQMSFMAVLSILIIYPYRFIFLPERWASPYQYYPDYEKLHKKSKRQRLLLTLKKGALALGKWSWGIATVSLAAQIGTMPIVAYYFGQVSCYSLLSSFIAIPAATLAIYLSIGTLIVPAALGIQGTLAALLAKTIHLCNATLSGIAHLPGACIQDIKINILQAGALYMFLIAGCLLIHKLRRFRLHRNRLSASGKGYSLREHQMLP